MKKNENLHPIHPNREHRQRLPARWSDLGRRRRPWSMSTLWVHRVISRSGEGCGTSGDPFLLVDWPPTSHLHQVASLISTPRFMRGLYSKIRAGGSYSDWMRFDSSLRHERLLVKPGAAHGGLPKPRSVGELRWQMWWDELLTPTALPFTGMSATSCETWGGRIETTKEERNEIPNRQTSAYTDPNLRCEHWHPQRDRHQERNVSPTQKRSAHLELVRRIHLFRAGHQGWYLSDCKTSKAHQHRSPGRWRGSAGIGWGLGRDSVQMERG